MVGAERQIGSSSTPSIAIASAVGVTTAERAAGSGGGDCWRGPALATGTASHPKKQAAASGTKRVIVWQESTSPPRVGGLCRLPR